MKFKNYTIDGLIKYLESCKLCGDFDCHKVTRVDGELHMYNAEPKRCCLYCAMSFSEYTNDGEILHCMAHSGKVVDECGCCEDYN